jgi:GR25 family glycosyltransferase involved in LPS biosynthesis
MFIHHIIYINLDHRKDRLEQIQTELSTLPPFTFEVERYEAIKTTPGIIGCGLSHLHCLKRAKGLGYPFVWIMEDDFTFTADIMQIMETLLALNEQIVANPLTFDVIMLAYHMLEYEPTNLEYLVKTTNCQTASCYIVAGHYYDTLINNLEEGVQRLMESNGEMHYYYANDQYWKSLQRVDNWVAVVPRFGIQRGSFSDNANEYMDYGV